MSSMWTNTTYLTDNKIMHLYSPNLQLRPAPSEKCLLLFAQTILHVVEPALKDVLTSIKYSSLTIFEVHL